jgi:hypothetical protein
VTILLLCIELAERQHGLISRGQLRGLGATPSMIRHLVASPAWEAVTHEQNRG